MTNKDNMPSFFVRMKSHTTHYLAPPQPARQTQAHAAVSLISLPGKNVTKIEPEEKNLSLLASNAFFV